MIRFTDSHEWIKIEGKIASIGLTHYAQEELGPIVYIDLPEIGRLCKAGEPVCLLESSKAASDIYAPISGRIVAVNTALSENPSLINAQAESGGWIFKIDSFDPAAFEELMTLADYQLLLQ